MKGFAIDSPPALGNICSAFWMCFPSRTCFNKIITFSVVRKSSAIKYFFFSSTLKTCWPLVNEEVKKLCAHRVWLVLFFQKLLWWSQYDRLYQSRSSEQWVFHGICTSRVILMLHWSLCWNPVCKLWHVSSTYTEWEYESEMFQGMGRGGEIVIILWKCILWYFFPLVVSQLWNGLSFIVRHVRKSLAEVQSTWDQIIMCTIKLFSAESKK